LVRGQLFSWQEVCSLRLVPGRAHMSVGIVRAISGGTCSTAAEVLASIGTGLYTVGDMFDWVSRGRQHGANRQSILGGHPRRD